MAYITVRFNSSGLVSKRYSTHNHSLAIDSVPPVITLIGSSSVSVPINSVYNDPGATAEDNLDGDITNQIQVTGGVNTGVAGTYILTYRVSDSSGNQATPRSRTVVVGDYIPPVITLFGSSTVNLAEGDEYVDAGALAVDNAESDISHRLVVTNEVDTSHPGTYLVRYNVTDSAGNIAQEVIRTVNVADITKPVITLLGDNPALATIGEPYVDAGVLVIDNADGDITEQVVTDNQVNTAVGGTYIVRYNVADFSGNVADEVVRTVFVQNADGVPPEIQLIGSSIVTITQGDVYNDAGATALDDFDGDVTDDIVVTSNVDTEAAGTYQVRYNVADRAGNNATEVVRTVVVREPDVEPPLITLEGSANVSVFQHDVYVDAGATAHDARDGNVTAAIEVDGNVDVSTVGVYQVRYNVEDSSGNQANEVVRTVSVQDGTYPVITVLGESPVLTPVLEEYEDAGATAVDNQDGDITNQIVATSDVDTDTVGDYTVRYNVQDSDGNPALEVTRTVRVIDTDPPVITLLGDNPAVIVQGNPYVDAGATAYDAQDGDVTGDIIVHNPVSINSVGTYTVTYNVSDSSENEAQQVTRTVHVADGLPPEITVLGDNPVTVIQGHAYIDAGATAHDAIDGDVTSGVDVTNPVNVNVVDQYTVTYEIVDIAGNRATATRTVNVVAPDDEAPVITILGDNPAFVTVGNSYVDAGATALDSVSGDLTGSVERVDAVDTDTVGTYTVTYAVTDAANNEAQATRTVYVEPADKAPVLTLLGGTIFLDVGDPFVDPGCLAEDEEDGDLTDDIVVTDNVNTLVPGVYTVTYNVEDSAGNDADPVTRDVIVQSNEDLLVTANHNFELPHADHFLEDDVVRLRQTIMAMDALLVAAQSNLTDATAGRLIKNGGHGLGAAEGGAIILDSVDLDTRADNLRAFCTNCDNTPPDASDGWLVVDPGSTANMTSQMYHERVSNRLWVRAESGGAWSSWQRCVFASEIAGLVGTTNRVSMQYLSSPGGLTADYAYLLGAAGSYILPAVSGLSAGAAVRVTKTIAAGNPSVVVEGSSGELIRTDDNSDTSLLLDARVEFTIIFNGTDWEV